jgi:membrane associated rhomboid family serine protease
MNPAPVGFHCPDCAGERTRTYRGPSAVTGAVRATYALIAISVVVFLAELGSGGDAASIEGGGTLIRDGGLFGPAIADDGEWYRIVTSGFLHAGPLHLLLNMFVLYVLGGLLEPAIGAVRYVGLYVISLLGGSLGALILDPNTITVGASGAVYGLMGAAIVIARHRGVEDVASQLGFWLVLNLAFTFSVPGISIGGHLGGLAAGGLGAFAISRIGVAAGPRAQRLELGALALIGIAAVIGSFIAANASSTGLG